MLYKNHEAFKVKAQSSAGSVEKLRKVDRGKAEFGAVYSGHVYLGRNGLLKHDTKKYKNVMAEAYLYGAPAQLVTRKGSGINSVKGLVGKKVGVGNAGSGAYANCELFFTHMGVWDKIEQNTLGYNNAAAFGNKQLDAFWLFTAFPRGAVTMAAQFNDYDSPFFQDSILWVANANVPDQVVYDLARMRSQKQTFKEMKVKDGVKGIVTPMYPGAVRFWKEKGVH